MNNARSYKTLAFTTQRVLKHVSKRINKQVGFFKLHFDSSDGSMIVGLCEPNYVNVIRSRVIGIVQCCQIMHS